ncbi:putative transmembrane protein [Cucumis melo var. makuwa]|nr:putative transmembrane protein [Cucumis melo var. makuwa]
MVRSFPTDDNPLIHPAISLFLLAAGMAAAIAMITTLCGVRSRRRSTPSEASSPTATENNKAEENVSPTTTTPSLATAANPSDRETENEGEVKELPLPPKMQQVTSSSPPNQILKSASERKLNHMRSMSIKVPRSLSVVRNHLDEGRQRRKEKIKGEDSIWTKTIILGEKCKVSDEEDGIIYEGKGKKITAYHPRAPSSMSISMSRQNSANEAEALPNSEAK